MSIPDYTASMEKIKAARAARVAAGDRFAIMLRAGRDRAAAEQRWRDERERERLRDLLGLDDAVASKSSKTVIVTPPDGTPLTATQAAARLSITAEQLMAHVEDGTLGYINVGRGKKRPRYRFDPADLDAFKAARTTMEQPCQSSSPRSLRRITGTASKSNVVGFMAQRAARLARKPKR